MLSRTKKLQQYEKKIAYNMQSRERTVWKFPQQQKEIPQEIYGKHGNKFWCFLYICLYTLTMFYAVLCNPNETLNSEININMTIMSFFHYPHKTDWASGICLYMSTKVYPTF